MFVKRGRSVLTVRPRLSRASALPQAGARALANPPVRRAQRMRRAARTARHPRRARARAPARRLARAARVRRPPTRYRMHKELAAAVGPTSKLKTPFLRPPLQKDSHSDPPAVASRS